MTMEEWKKDGKETKEITWNVSICWALTKARLRPTRHSTATSPFLPAATLPTLLPECGSWPETIDSSPRIFAASNTTWLRLTKLLKVCHPNFNIISYISFTPIVSQFHSLWWNRVNLTKHGEISIRMSQILEHVATHRCRSGQVTKFHLISILNIR